MDLVTNSPVLPLWRREAHGSFQQEHKKARVEARLQADTADSARRSKESRADGRMAGSHQEAPHIDKMGELPTAYGRRRGSRASRTWAGWKITVRDSPSSRSDGSPPQVGS